MRVVRGNHPYVQSVPCYYLKNSYNHSAATVMVLKAVGGGQRGFQRQHPPPRRGSPLPTCHTHHHRRRRCRRRRPRRPRHTHCRCRRRHRCRPRHTHRRHCRHCLCGYLAGPDRRPYGSKPRWSRTHRSRHHCRCRRRPHRRRRRRTHRRRRHGRCYLCGCPTGPSPGRPNSRSRPPPGNTRLRPTELDFYR